MPMRFAKIIFAALVLLCFCVSGVYAENRRPAHPLRVAYIEGGPYTDYQKILLGLVHGLAELGAINNGDVPPPEDEESTAGIWQWLCANAGGKFFEFVPDAYYSSGWDDAVFAEDRQKLIDRLNNAKDIDLVLSFGTLAGQGMATDEHRTPVAVLSVTDAVAAGIVPSYEDSGRDNIFAMVEPGRYYRQVVLFHDIFHFKRLGIAYEDTPAGRASAALSDIERAAADFDFELVTCTAPFNFSDPAPAVTNLIACHEKLAEEGVDAVYITVNMGMQAEAMPQLMKPLLERRIPTFSQNGVDEVKNGVLLSISQADFSGQGLFAAQAVFNIAKGQSPRAQNQIYEEPMSLAVNLHTAMLIGWNPSLAVLAAVDEIYQAQ